VLYTAVEPVVVAFFKVRGRRRRRKEEGFFDKKAMNEVDAGSQIPVSLRHHLAKGDVVS